MANRHERVTELLSSYIDHQLSTDEQARVEAHLATCAACRRELQQWQRLVALLRACPQVRPPRAFALSLDVVASQGLILRLARFAPAVTALAAVLLAALLFADVRTLSQRSMPPASRPSLSVPSTALAVAIAATPPPAAAAPAASVAAPAMPTPAATEAVAREAVATAEPEERALAAPMAPATETPAADIAPAGGASPTQAVGELVAESEASEELADSQQKSLETTRTNATEAPATPSPTPAEVAALIDEEAQGTAAAPATPEAARRLEEDTAVPEPQGEQGSTDSGLMLLRMAEALVALVLLTALALWLWRLLRPARL